jgi:hypothetical protein
MVRQMFVNKSLGLICMQICLKVSLSFDNGVHGISSVKLDFVSSIMILSLHHDCDALIWAFVLLPDCVTVYVDKQDTYKSDCTVKVSNF